MEQRLLYFLLFFSFIGIEIKADVGSYREIVNLNREWTYKRGDYTGAQRADYDDSSWEFIGLPHSFSIPYFMSKDFYTGYGWYRKQISLSKTLQCPNSPEKPDLPVYTSPFKIKPAPSPQLKLIKITFSYPLAHPFNCSP